MWVIHLGRLPPRQHGESHHCDLPQIFAVAAGFATTLGVLAQPQAAEAKRKPPPPVEKKVEEDKSLSAYDARLLANTRRKEAMKENIDKLEAKASVGTVETAKTAGTAETAETAS